MELKYYIGVDVSKKKLDMALLVQGKVVAKLQCENTKKGIGQAVKSLRKVPGFGMAHSVFCMEHTGIYCQPLLDFLFSCKSKIWLESAMQIKKSQGLSRGKTDQIDAERIALYAYTFKNRMQLWQPPRKEVLRLRHLLTMRDRLVNSMVRITQPLQENKEFIEAGLAKMERAAFKSTIKGMKKDLQAIEDQIQELIEQDDHLKRLFGLSTSIDGIGKITAVNVIAVTNEFSHFSDPKKFACYCGVAPFEHTSGTSIRGKTRVSHLANKKIKTLFHLAALSAIKMKGELQNYFQRKLAEGKNKMSILNAIRNKLIHRLFAVIKRGTPYQKQLSFEFA